MTSRVPRAASRVVLGAILFSSATVALGHVFMTQERALSLAFPADVQVARETVFLKAEQVAAAKKLSGSETLPELVIRYRAERAGQLLGYAYFDTHRVRTLPETLMVVVSPAGEVERIEILSFGEPQDYFPKRRWLDQFLRRKLDDELSVRRGIRPISGATLTGRAIVNAARRVLAVHEVLATKAQP